jgi:integrase/recombinase XerD
MSAVSSTATLRVWVARYLEHLAAKNYSERSLVMTKSRLGGFVRWCEEHSVTRPEEVTKPIVERYQRFLFHFRKADGRPLSFRTQGSRLSPLRLFFRWLVRQNILLWNPASDLELPRPERRLPQAVLTESEVERVLAMPDVREPRGLRDRAILEVLYATGIRRAELVGLRVDDVNVERQTLMVRLGKGKKDRVVPLGERALAWVMKYLDIVRPDLAGADDLGALFLTRFGEAPTTDSLSRLAAKYIEDSGVGKKGACHLFRHTMATLMLEGGADVRYVQEMLGHANLETTQIYTRVSVHKLREVHTATHPGARLERRPPLRKAREDDAALRDELLSSLAAEAADELASSG